MAHGCKRQALVANRLRCAWRHESTVGCSAGASIGITSGELKRLDCSGLG